MIIYKTTNLINGKIYVGKDVFNNPNYFGSGIILTKSIKKYGISNFQKEILEECQSLKELNDKEIFWIDKLNSTNKKIGYNIAKGGDGGDTFSNQSVKKKKDVIEKRRKSSKDLFASEEWRKKRSKLSKKMWKNPNHIKHMKKVMTGRKITWKRKIGEGSRRHWKLNGDVRSEETKNRMYKITSQKMTGKELKVIPDELKPKIIKLYEIMGAKLIEKKLGISRYLITKFLKKEGIYQKWQKGIGDKSKKECSISRRGNGNPMWKDDA